LHTFQKASDNAVAVTADLRLISQKTTKGEGAIGQLFMNETLAQQVELAMDSLTRASENSVQMLKNMEEFTQKLNNPNSPLGILLTDTVLAKDIEQTIIEVKGATQTFDEAARKINNHWFLNPVFGKKEKKGEKDKDKKANEQSRE
jgi:phospholipid/cholesterol/gamma-HCH transport system substrate-binding protein